MSDKLNGLYSRVAQLKCRPTEETILEIANIMQEILEILSTLERSK